MTNTGTEYSNKLIITDDDKPFLKRVPTGTAAWEPAPTPSDQHISQICHNYLLYHAGAVREVGPGALAEVGLAVQLRDSLELERVAHRLAPARYLGRYFVQIFGGYLVLGRYLGRHFVDIW